MGEVARVATLGHPAIAKAEAFLDADHLILATPERGGVTLADLMDRLEQRGDDLPPSAVLHVAAAVAGALAASHAAALDDDPVGRICHGFLSPAWIWLDWSGEVSVDALGLAAIASAPGLRTAPAYDAPEQRAGGKATPRGDVYSLAAIVWALLAAQPATEALSVDGLGERLPASLRPLLVRALEPSLGKRTITSEELATLLAAMTSDEGKQALTAALVALRKGTNVLGTLRAPGVAPVAPGGVPGLPKPPAPAPLKSTLPAIGAPLPRPAGGPAVPPRPAGPSPLPRPAGPPLSPAAVGAPLGTRLPPPRAKLGSTGEAVAPPAPPPAAPRPPAASPPAASPPAASPPAASPPAASPPAASPPAASPPAAS
ncbi:MAG: hypothetical protein FJ095_20590, partial [Deltaproteobacteria bacterium]|nr:hypothetical protein [Deltaproteobacteria bacterium]